ncbi:MAG: tyrosine-type recombinase/integrase [Acetobacteraceae bacterium]|nr:tyrosine-type recombinase/integrase [Acetobacteraceae bacterium]
MSGLQAHVDDYLRLRRALGFKLKEDERTLGQLVGYLEAASAETVISELAIRWARLPVGVHPNQWAKRLRIAREFAAYLQTVDPTAEVPPPDVFPVRRQRATPYLFSQDDICRLLAEARRLRNPMRAASYEALFGLLAISGMRIGEALALERSDVELDVGLITIRKAKGDRARLVPLHRTATEALRHYASARDRLCPRPRSRAFFLSSAGTPVLGVSLRATFREISTQIGLCTKEVQPRIHDLRHRFAVQTLIDWQRSGVNVDERIAMLSTYLGHVSPADTYWYLSASPELMALAANRVHDRFGGVR